MEILKDDRYYYRSGVDDRYDKLTPRGEEALQHFLKIMAPHMLRAEEESLDMRAKQLVLKELNK